MDTPTNLIPSEYLLVPWVVKCPVCKGLNCSLLFSERKKIYGTGSDFREYLANIGIVDEGIKRTVEAIELFYGNDGQTAFVVTADHGMTNWGNLDLIIL